MNFYEANSTFLISEEKKNYKISERSRKDYHAVIVNRFIPFLQKKNVKHLKEITPHLMDDFQDSLLLESIKPQTVNNYYKAIRKIFKYLMRKGILLENPCDSVKYIPVHQSDQEARGCYEIEKVWGVFNRKWKDELSYLLCLIIYTTGMRNGEITRFSMDDITSINGCRFIDIKESKTPSGLRLVPLHDFVYQKLKAYASKKNTADPVIGKQRPEAFIKANGELARRLKVSEEELEKENITFYSGRHYWKTMMNREGLGEDIEEIFMGHLVSSNVAKRYNHRDKQGQAQLVRKAKQVLSILDKCIFRVK
jgi:integrase